MLKFLLYDSNKGKSLNTQMSIFNIVTYEGPGTKSCNSPPPNGDKAVLLEKLSGCGHRVRVGQ